MKSVSEVYDREFFRQHSEGREEYRRVADAIERVLGPVEGKRVLDFGCGPGFCLARLQELGANCIGIEGSVSAVAFSEIPDKIDIYDLRNEKHWGPEGYADLTICTEVAEHLPAEYAEHLVDTLCHHTKLTGTIAMTAAPPGQGGHEHINEQPATYWIDKFMARGWRLDGNRTFAMRDALMKTIQQQVWYINNFLCFSR